MSDGWIKFHRTVMESSVWVKPIIFMVWSWCLLKANHEDKKFPFNGTDITIEKGSFITGIEKAVSEIPTLTPQRYRTAINYLKSTNRITIKTTNKFTVITINNWEEYQLSNMQNNKQITNKQQTNNKQITTNNNIKNDKNVKNNNTDIPLFPLSEIPKTLTAKNSLCPCTAEELSEIALKLRIPLQTVIDKHESILEMIEIGEFNKRKYKTLYYTLKSWLDLDIKRGFISREQEVVRI